MNSNFETSVSDIRIVSPERNYWFLRTYGGSTFEDNYINGYVGIGFNEIPMQYLKNAKGDDFASLEILRGFIEKQYDIKKGSLTRWINQLVEFQHSVKIGDMVLIPSENSDNILFGEITSDIYVVKEKRTFLHNDKYESYPEKRRAVKWQTIYTKTELKYEWGNMFFGRNALTNINEYEMQSKAKYLQCM